MLCDGHSEVMSGSISYSYKDGGILETLDYIETNIALETLAQLKVRDIYKLVAIKYCCTNMHS